MLWINSKRASFINGEVLVLDGGAGLTTSSYVDYVKYAELADENQQAALENGV